MNYKTNEATNQPQRSANNALGCPPAPKTQANLLSAPETASLGHIDGRTLRATGRTEQLNLRVTKKLKQDLKILSAKSSVTLGELIAELYEFFKEQKQI